MLISASYVFILQIILTTLKNQPNQLIILLFIPAVILISNIFNILIKKIIDLFPIANEKKYLYDLLPAIKSLFVIIVFFYKLINFPILLLISLLGILILIFFRCGKKDY